MIEEVRHGEGDYKVSKQKRMEVRSQFTPPFYTGRNENNTDSRLYIIG